MKDYKIVFAAVALGLSILIIGLFTVSVFNYIAFLKQQNYTLLENINSSISQLTNSVMALQSQERFRQIVDLKSENILLKKQAERLKRELHGRQAFKDAPGGAKMQKDGNRGYVSGAGPAD